MLRPELVTDEHQVFQIDSPTQQEEEEEEGSSMYEDDIASGSSTSSLSVPSPKLVAKFRCPDGATATATASASKSSLFYYRLVECNSEILVVGTKWTTTNTKCLGVGFSVYRLADLIMGRVVPLTSIDGSTLFLGRRTLCVSARAFPGGSTIVPDTINCHLRPHALIYLCQYHLRDGTVSQAAADRGVVEEKDVLGPYSIVCHLITCCYPEYWNKGKIVCKEVPTWRVKKKFRYGA